MAKLSTSPAGTDLEDLISAHFASRGCYVETAVTERVPDEILELDIVWTDYRGDPEVKRPVEVKSGDWHLSDVFKFYGWTRYLGLEPGQFIHKETCGRLNSTSLKHVQKGTGIEFWHISGPEDANSHLKNFGLPEPASPNLPDLWRFSFSLRRRLRKSLGIAIGSKVCPETAKATKEYLKLVNDAVFFIPDVRDRIEKLVSAHLEHQELGESAAYEIESGRVEFRNPPSTHTFKRAYFGGRHFPVQACLYAAHRGRLYILKALVDYWLSRQRSEIKNRKIVFKFRDHTLGLPLPDLTDAMATGLEKLGAAKSFRLLPVFWQTFLWSWGGFLLNDRLDEEYAALERETGVPTEDIPTALTAFDRIFPTQNGWFRDPHNDDRHVLILMPAPMRGLGAFRRLAQYGVEQYEGLKCGHDTAWRMTSDQDAAARLLDCDEADLVR